MDFTLSEADQAIRDLTARVLGDLSTHERLRELSRTGDRIDRQAWIALAETGVIGAALPERHGGLGLDFMAPALALEQVGFHASVVPLLSTVVMGAVPIAAFGTSEQQAAWLPAVADGSRLLCAAVAADGAPASQPAPVARPDGAGYVLDGVVPLVPGGLDAAMALVSARLPGGEMGVFCVPVGSDGFSVEPVEVTTGRTEARFELVGVVIGPEARLGGDDADGAGIVDFIELRARVGLCMLMAGAARAAVELAAVYTRQRHQFDRPIATFQAVSQRAGDSYIDIEAIRLTAYQAAWRVATGRTAHRETAIAKYWAAEGGFRAVHAAVHVHGGVGVDRDYPLHRHFLLARWIELTLGHAEEQLRDLGRLLAGSGTMRTPG